MELSEYVLHPLRNDEEFVLYRGEQSKQPMSPSVLLLTPVSSRPALETVKKMEREYSLRNELDSAWAVRPRTLSEQGGQTMLVLEDPGGETLDRFLRRPIEIPQFLRLAVNLSMALRGLHGRELIHKDVKPANVLVNSLTGQVRLMGFGIASRLPRERQTPEPPEFIAGTLPYMAPEQTGRMNRSIDSRSDLYALGVTLYEMLTGNLPFTASDPMELVHCHVARQPMPPCERLPSVPEAVSAIIMKLLAKIAEERYQTAVGVAGDLSRCLAEWETQHRIVEFPLGEKDMPDRLLIPEKLYGRESEINILLAAFDRVVTTDRPELVLVSGYSGIGKSSVVNELHKVLLPPRGLFASGKFDHKRDIPYATLAQAFQSLMRRLLGKGEADLAPWRDALREALGLNGQLIIDLVPELKLLVGEQPPVTDLPAQEAQQRFQFVFRRFVGVFAKPEHPLALFLDDLQWIDMATLDLLENILTRSGLQHLLLIGAYRNNEVSAAHPLMLKLAALTAADATVSEIALSALTRDHLGQLIADSLRCTPERAAPLSQLVHEKTDGNPFFAIQFLSSLAEERLIAFDRDAARWSWDLDRIHARGYTVNVVDLMAVKLTRLPAETQRALERLACLGNSAETVTLSIILGNSEEQVHADLWPSVRQELAERHASVYRFVHDRIQEAAYALIPAGERGLEHLRIGRLLAAHTLPEAMPEHVFEIVTQFNRGALITSTDERERVAELNVIAGRQARASTAYASALTYFAAGAALLPADAWERRHDLAFALELQRAECEFQVGDVDAAENRLMSLSARAANLSELAAITCLRVELFTPIGRIDSAVEACLEFLRYIGVQWSAHPTKEQVNEESERLWRQIGSRSIAEFVHLPLMSDPESRVAMDVLNAVLPAAHFADDNLLGLVSLRMANLSLEHGNHDVSCVGYVYLAMVLGPGFGNYRAAFSFGKLGLDLMEQRGLRRFEARVCSVFGHLVVPYTQPLSAGRGLVEHALDVAIRVGDPTYAAFSRVELFFTSYAEGRPLSDVQREGEAALDFARQVWGGIVIDTIAVHLQQIRSLRGLTEEFGSLNDSGFDEGRFEQHLAENPRLSILAGQYWISKLPARFFAGAYVAALDAASNARRLILMFQRVQCHLYAAMASAALCDVASAEERLRQREALAAHHRQFQEWAENGVANIEDSAALVGAEVARIEGHDTDAMRLYEVAIAAAKANGFIQNEALANELAARFYAARGFGKIADVYLHEARYTYLRWGANGKVHQLDQQFPQLRQEKPVAGSTSMIGAPIEHLDLATVIEVSQAVSGEMVLEKLIDRVMRAAIEHAGAGRGLLIVPQGDDLRLEAEAVTREEGIAVHLRGGAPTTLALGESVVRYAMRTQETVILDDAWSHNPFSDDPYLVQRRARSILCVPLMNQGKLSGILYLENNLTPHVFTPDRVTVLKVLASQAAISLENTRLYRDLEDREGKIRRLVDANVLGIIIAKLEGTVVDANEAFLRMVQYSREDLVSRHVSWMDLTPPEWRERDARALLEVKTTGIVQPYEKEFLRKDGSRVPALIGAAVFREGGGEGVAFVLDLSEQKRVEAERKSAEDRLRELRAKLARASRIATVAELSASIAHELNQPLTSVVANAQGALRWLSNSPPNLSEAMVSIERVVRDGRAADARMQHIRALFKKETFETKEVEVSEMIGEAIRLIREDSKKPEITIDCETDHDLPPVIVDPIQIQEVLINLLSNAIEAMGNDVRPPHLTIRARLIENSEVLIEVMDNGPGLDETEQIFDAFVTTKDKGMGIGLAVSRSIVEAHDGQLWAKNNPDGGAKFSMKLPVASERLSARSVHCNMDKS